MSLAHVRTACEWLSWASDPSIPLLTKTVGRPKWLNNKTAALVPYINNQSEVECIQSLRKEQKKVRVRGGGSAGDHGRLPSESKFVLVLEQQIGF